MKTYEGLFILNTAGKEDSIKEMIDRVTEELTAAGGKVQTVQKMEKRPFARVANRRYTTGYYVNFIFDAEPETVRNLQSRFARNEDVFRIMCSLAPSVASPPVPA